MKEGGRGPSQWDEKRLDKPYPSWLKADGSLKLGNLKKAE